MNSSSGCFTGREWDYDTKLKYNRARWYNPATGRWMSEDPLGFAAGDTNVSRYVENSSVNHIDPSGKDILDNAINFSAGWADAFTFGITNDLRNQWGINGQVNHNSGYYRAGHFGGLVNGGLLVGAVSAWLIAFAGRLAASGLVYLGMSGVNATATVTLTLGLGGLAGTGFTAYGIYTAYQAGNWDYVVFYTSMLAGGWLQGMFSARPMVNRLNALSGRPPSTQPPSVNPYTYWTWAKNNLWRGWSTHWFGPNGGWAAMKSAPDPAGAAYCVAVIAWTFTWGGIKIAGK